MDDAPTAELPCEPSIAARCRDLGIAVNAEVRAPPRSTAHAEIRDYTTRTFSRADATEPLEPAHVRAVCCRRLSGPAMGFVEVPDNRMHWAPVDMSHRTERWACSCCPGLALRAAATSPTDPVPASLAPDPPRLPSPNAPADLAQMPPPPLPFAQHTNSRIYVPLLLHAAGMASPGTRDLWTAEPSFGAWWRRQVDATSAQPFLPVHDTLAAIIIVAQARGDDLSESAPFLRLASWAAQRPSSAESLRVLLRVIAVPEEGHYIPAAMQKGLLTLLLGQDSALALERDVDALRRLGVSPDHARAPPPSAPTEPLPPPAAAPPTSPEARTPRGVSSRPRVALTSAPAVAPGNPRLDDDDDDPPDMPQAGAGSPALVGVPASAWSSLDAVDLAAEFGTPMPTMQSVPVFLRHGVRQAFILALRAGCSSTALASQATLAEKHWCNGHETSSPDDGTPCSLPRARPLARRTLDETPMPPMPPTTTLARGVGHLHVQTCGGESLAHAAPTRRPLRVNSA
eukprot:s5110_g1.t1